MVGIKRKCCVPDCEDRISKRHRFTKDPELLIKWLKNINNPALSGKTVKQLYENYRVCHRHFPEEFYYQGSTRGRDVAPYAYPTLFLPKTAIDKTLITCRTIPAVTQIGTSEQSKEEVPAESAEFKDDQPVIDTEDSDIQNENSAGGVHEASTRNVEIQVNSGDFRTKFIDQLRNDADLSTATGIESFALLETILDIVKIADLKKDDSSVKMNLRDRVILTFVKLKQNLSYAFLSILFDCADRCSQRIFCDSIVLLSTCLKQFIAWPTKKELLKNMPSCFAKYHNVRVVVDCTEFYTQHPKNLCCQVVSNSHYKSAQTWKVMTGVTPAGNISFVSKVYGGRCSDKSIFEQSEIIKLCEPGDAVMVDGGFLIDDICDLYGIECIRPPILNGETRCTKSDAILTGDIAKARVHVKRVSQRIKIFQMLGDTLPTHLVPLLDDILTVVCAVVNLSDPIMKDDKFVDV